MNNEAANRPEVKTTPAITRQSRIASRISGQQSTATASRSKRENQERGRVAKHEQRMQGYFC
jgi:hypothetical protein